MSGGSPVARSAVAVSALLGLTVLSAALRAPDRDAGNAGTPPPARTTPVPVDDRLGVVTVRVESGGAVRRCSGIPVAGSPYVVTAAHCLLWSPYGAEIAPDEVTVLADEGGGGAVGVALRIAPEYRVEPAVWWDVAVVETDRPWSTGVDHWGAWDPAAPFEVVAYQFVGPGGMPVERGDDPVRPCDLFDCTDEPELRRYSNQLELTTRRLMSCTGDPGEITVTTGGAVEVPCGLLAGASGGPVVQVVDGATRLVGVVSTICAGRCANAVAPATVLDQLIGGPNAG